MIVAELQVVLNTLTEHYIQDSLKMAELRVYGLVVRVPGYRSRGPGSIPDATRFSEK
jgi:hypothetical protein